jgi:hypothetical protein
VTNECTSVAAHFDGHAKVLKQYMRHRPMHHVQGYTGSHWTPPSSDYSLRIASAAARATANKTSNGRFDGHRDAAVLYRVHRPMEEVCGFHKSH